MAFCTQRKFPGQSYENSGLAEICRMKAYSSIKDHRTWSIDQNQQTSYLVDAVHKGDEVDLQRNMTIGLSRCKSEIQKTSKRVGTTDVDQHSSVTSPSDSLQMFELSMVLEDMKLKNSTLKTENADLRKRIANVMAFEHENENEENIHNLQILEKIISERNDLRDLLDKFLGVTDQIVDLKIQANKAKNVESDFILLQTKFKDQQMELETLRNGKEALEERIREFQTKQVEADALKESNSKLEKDLYELSNVISVSDNFIHDQDDEIKTKLHTIAELNEQIDNLKVALSEAEMKLNKKLRLEMDVGLMEKELSMMIENASESHPYHQQVVDRQVEDLATAIKLTLGCMNFEFENNEEDNLAEANRQLKMLLLESSNKILEFKDVINKQEQNLMKVTNDFANKNDELTECLATVEELKRQIANIDTPNAQNVVLPCTDNLPTVGIDEEQEIFEKEINLADSPQISENEDDGPEIEDLENIFEKSCRQQEQGRDRHTPGFKPNTRQSEELRLFKQSKSGSIPDNKPELPSETKAGTGSFSTKADSCSAERLRRLSVKIEHMSSYINDLETQNNELKSQINERSPTGSRNINELKNNERDKFTVAVAAKGKEDQNEELKMENANIYTEIDPENHDLISRNEELRNANEQLLRKISLLERDAQNQPGRFSTTSQEFESDLLSSDVQKIENENLNLKLENEKLVVEIGKLKNLENSSHLSVLEMKKEMDKLTSINEQLTTELSAKKLEKDLLLVKEVDTMPPELRDLVLRNDELRKDNENLLLKIRCLEQSENLDRPKDSNLSGQNRDEEVGTEPEWLPSNEDLVAEIEKLQQCKNKSSLAIRQIEKDLRKMELVNENLLSQLNDKEAELKQLSMPPDTENILKQNEELKMLNRNLNVEISELKKSDNVQANKAIIKEEMETLETVNKALLAEINELKQNAHITDTKTNQQPSKIIDTGLSSEVAEPISPQNSSHISILKIGKDLERLAALNESLLSLNDTDIDKKNSLVQGMAPDINQLLKKNQELKLANESLSTKIRELQDTEHKAHFQAIGTENQLKTLAAANEQLQARIRDLERFSSSDRATNLQSLKNENENLKTASDKLIGQIAFLEEKLQNIENRSATQFDQRPTSMTSTSTQLHSNSGNLEIDWMVADMKKLQSRNENLRLTNENLLSQISELQSCVDRSKTRDDIKIGSDKTLDNTESDAQLIYACNRNIEIEWMKADMSALHKKNEKLKSTNDGLVAEIGTLKCSETQARKNVQQMEKNLLRLSAMNERLTNQVNEKKQLLKVRSQELETKDLLKKIEELSNSNECLASENTELKGLDLVKMRNDLRKLSSTNDRLKSQIAELKLLSSNELKMESNWMAADMKKLFSKNKKLNISNQSLVNEINDLRGEFKSLENRANLNALQKVKEMDRLTALNENLRDQLNAVKNEKKNCNCNEIGSDCSVSNAKTLHKKNEELKAANEKLLSVIVNLKNAEKQAISKVSEMENELHKLRETNKSLQDTLENYVEKDWSIPKTELERICQSILNEGANSLTDTDYHYMQNWFGKSASSESDVAKTSRKNTTRKHCKICRNSVDAFGKTCECKQYEEKKRLNLLKEIEETKLAIQHIQRSNDIEFDLNDVKNRLLKTKPSDSDDDSQYDIKMSQSQGSVNVRAHIITKCVKHNHRVRK